MILKRVRRAYGYVNQPGRRFDSATFRSSFTKAHEDDPLAISSFYPLAPLPRVHLDYRQPCVRVRAAQTRGPGPYTNADTLMNLSSAMKRQTVLIAAPGYARDRRKSRGILSAPSLPRYLALKARR